MTILADIEINPTENDLFRVSISHSCVHINKAIALFDEMKIAYRPTLDNALGYPVPANGDTKYSFLTNGSDHKIFIGFLSITFACEYKQMAQEFIDHYMAIATGLGLYDKDGKAIPAI